jgi:hypothetical protein
LALADKRLIINFIDIIFYRLSCKVSIILTAKTGNALPMVRHPPMLASFELLLAAATLCFTGAAFPGPIW